VVTLLFARHQLRLQLRSPGILALFVVGPLFIIFVFGQAFTAIFAAGNQGFSAMQYFGVTLLTMAVFQGSFLASWAVFKEKRSNAEARLGVAPIGRVSATLGAFLGSWLSIAAIGCVVMALGSVFLSIDYGDRPWLSALLVCVEALLASSLGVSLAVVFGQERAANGVLNAIVPLLVFIGGGYTIIPDSGLLHELSRFSPIRWINLAMLDLALPDTGEYVAAALSFSLAASAALMSIACLRSWRKR